VVASLIVVDGSRMPASRKRVGLGCGAPVAKGGSFGCRANPSEPRFFVGVKIGFNRRLTCYRDIVQVSLLCHLSNLQHNLLSLKLLKSSSAIKTKGKVPEEGGDPFGSPSKLSQRDC
jgi:hypothetical protein